MNKFEYKKAYEDIAPSEELIGNTLLKIEKQKRSKVIKFSTYFQIAAAACFCFFVGIGASNLNGLNSDKNIFVGSIFGKGSAWVLAVILFALITTVIVILGRRRK